MRRSKVAAWIVAGMLVGSSRTVRAEGSSAQAAKPPPASQPTDSSEPFLRSIDVGVGTSFPIMVGGVSTVAEGPLGLQLRVDLGWLGTPYLEAIDGILFGVGAYGSGASAEATSELIRAGLDNSFTGRVGLGIHPVSDLGLELFVGYTVNALGGSLSATQAVEAVAGKTFPKDSSALEANVNSTLHSVYAGVGWQWPVADAFVIRSCLGYLQTVASSTTISVEGRRNERELSDISASTDAYLHDLYTTWVKVPVIDVGVSYRF